MHENQKTASKMTEYRAEATVTLKKYRGRPYGRLESILRRRFMYILPPWSRPFLASLRFAYATKAVVCKGRGEGWKVEIKYTV